MDYVLLVQVLKSYQDLCVGGEEGRGVVEGRGGEEGRG